MKKHICPVCEKYLFDKDNSYDICPVCGWEDDGSQLARPDKSGGANKLSLNDYRLQWKEKEAARKASRDLTK